MNTSMKNKVLNIGAITLQNYPDKFIIDPKFKTTKISTKLVIDKQNQEIQELDFNQRQQQVNKTANNNQDKKLLESILFSVFIGVIIIKDVQFLVFAKDVMLVAIIEKHDIFMLKSICFVSTQYTKKEMKKLKEYQEIKTQIESMKQILSTGHYFSYSYDLTLNQQQQMAKKESRKSFIYNHNLQQNLIKLQINTKWLVSIVQGFIDQFEIYINGKKLNYILISRKSSKQSGTRFHSRGLDSHGNVANYVETEQICMYMSHLFSFTLIRGSVPLFWEQTGLTNQSIQVTKSEQESSPTFNQHIYKMVDQYKYVLFINLMNSRRAIEQKLNLSLANMIQNHCQSNKVKYVHFDYHQQYKACPSSANTLITSLQPQLDNFGFFGINQQAQEIVLQQSGVVRINCLDCLDRTNIIQTKLSCYILQQTLDCLQCDLFYLLKEHLHIIIDSSTNSHPLTRNLQKIWADNGDQLSQHYAGTDSTMSSMTRKGGRYNWTDILEMGVKGLERFWVSKYLDSQKQAGIDVFLGTSVDRPVQIINKERTAIQMIVGTDRSLVGDVQDCPLLVVGLIGVAEDVMIDIKKQIAVEYADRYTLVVEQSLICSQDNLTILLYSQQVISSRICLQPKADLANTCSTLKLSIDSSHLCISLVNLCTQDRSLAGQQLDTIYLTSLPCDYHLLMGVVNNKCCDQWSSFHYYSQVARIMVEPERVEETANYDNRMFVISNRPYKAKGYKTIGQVCDNQNRAVMAWFELEVEDIPLDEQSSIIDSYTSKEEEQPI